MSTRFERILSGFSVNAEIPQRFSARLYSQGLIARQPESRLDSVICPHSGRLHNRPKREQHAAIDQSLAAVYRVHAYLGHTEGLSHLGGSVFTTDIAGVAL